MTWAKYGTEFFDQLAEFDFPAELDDACQLVHTQALHYLYSTEDMGASFLKKNLRRIVSSAQADDAARALVKAGVWEDQGNRYKVLHHEDVFRQSLGYQLKERKRSKESMAKKRDREKTGGPGGPGGGVDVTQDVTRNVMRSQTDSQTTSSYSEASTQEFQNVNYSTGEIFGSSSASSGGEYEASSSPGEVDPIREFMRKHSA